MTTSTPTSSAPSTSPPTGTGTTGRTRASRGGRQPSEQAIDAAIDSATRLLRLPTFRDRYGEIADAAGREQLSYRAFLSELLLAECDDREERRAARRVHEAGFPRPKTLADFDFTANTAIKALGAARPERVVGRGADDGIAAAAANDDVKQVAVVVDPYHGNRLSDRGVG